MRRLVAAALLALTPLQAAAQMETPFLNSERLKLLERSEPLTAADIFPADPAAQLQNAYDCGGLEGLNSYISRLYGRQEIHYAAVHGDALRVKQLLLEGEDVNVRDNMLATPLTLAAGNGRLEIVKILLEAGADASLEDGAGFTAYERAVVEVWPEIVEVLRPYRDQAIDKNK